MDGMIVKGVEPINEAARPSEPSTSVTKIISDARKEFGDSRHCTAKEAIDYIERKFAAPQTSAEPAHPERKYFAGTGYLVAAPQPVAQPSAFPNDDPEHPIVGPEDGSPCCEHCAKHPGSQWTLRADQPVSRDAPPCTCNPKPLNDQHWTGCPEGTPKLEEIARQIVRKFADKYGNVGVSHQDIDMVSESLRPFITPASTGEANGTKRANEMIVEIFQDDDGIWRGDIKPLSTTNRGGDTSDDTFFVQKASRFS